MELAPLAMMVQGLYAIWRARNNALYNGVVADLASIMGSAMQALEEWQEARHKSDT